MSYRKENREKRDERIKNNTLITLFSLFFFLFPLNVNSQDSIPEKVDLSEEAKLKFQDFFFTALSQKSIGNYSKSIENLESCNQILSDNKAVFFEFSKNYLALNKTLLAREYINRALQQEPNNIWMLKHLVEINTKDKNFADAIKIQQKVVLINKKERENLVRLYLQNRDYDNAILLMNQLDEEKALSPKLRMFKQSLEIRKSKQVKTEDVSNLSTLEEEFKKNKSYEILEKIFKVAESNSQILLKYSDVGIELFPAQPYVYLVNARVLNIQNDHKKALAVLQNGIDFVIEEQMEVDFYKEMAKAYKGLGDKKMENNYIEKAKKIKS